MSSMLPSSGAQNRQFTTPPHHSRHMHTPSAPSRQLGQLVGRRIEIEALLKCLESREHRLITLTGPGGVGKTQLARHVARLMSESRATTVLFVPLATIESPALMPSAIAEVFGLELGRDGPIVDRIAMVAAGRDILLLVDNLEHVIEGAPFLSHLVESVPTLTLLATSRIRLHLSIEYEFRVSPLATSDPSGSIDTTQTIPAVQLFLRCVERIGGGVKSSSSQDELDTIRTICQRVDGLPLAIELAAARTRTLTPKELLDRLNRTLPWLDDGPRDAPVRLRTMHDAIA
jgi:predicted ATPase